MYTKTTRLLGMGVGLLVLAVILAALQGAASVSAASPAQEQAAPACMTCHENQYYLHDTGNWYCVAEASERCVNCHGGNPEALTETEAHAGMNANPFADGGAHCRDCHGDETAALIEQVTGLTGYHDSMAVEQYVPAETQAVSLPDEREAPLWIVPMAVLVFGFWAWLVLRSGRS